MVIDTPLKTRCSVHPAKHELQTFMRGELSLPEMLPIVRHMLSGCPECLEVTRPLWELMQEEPKRPGGRR